MLLTSGNTVKLGDFGLAVFLQDGQDSYKMERVGRLPVRYMPIESFGTKSFNELSDVWSFGVAMWEMMT